MYKVIEHITKVNRRNKATTGVIIINPDEPAYFIHIHTYANYILFRRAIDTNTERTFSRELASVFFNTEDIKNENRYFEGGRELTIQQRYY